ncbi:MAG: hypothetical protein KAJ62_10870, partial [Desulfobacteraceae bacterium]|nr:hypothetical protein [Desulfobacteraceae bacterium]
NFVTPQQRHNCKDSAILAKRKTVFKAAKKQHSEGGLDQPENLKFKHRFGLTLIDLKIKN